MLAELQQVTKYYDNPGSNQNSRVLHEISLQVAENDKIAIVGPSGSGKSTLLNILGTLDSPSAGKLIINGKLVENIQENKVAEIRNTFLGFVFQMHYLLPQLTLLENVLIPLLARKDKMANAAARQRALQLIDRVGLSQHRDKFPAQLSGGECQRTAVVRALINRPRLLLADEPTGSLDAENASQLADLLIDLNKEQGVAMVIVTHSIDLAARMDKVYRLHEGRLTPQKI